MPEAVKCEKCGEAYSAASMLFGTSPGALCKCSWMTLTEREFKKMFGYSFRQVVKQNEIAELDSFRIS